MQTQGLYANRLRELREARGLKLYDIAALLRVDPSTVNRWETGRVSNVPDDAKLALARFFDVSVAHLMGWDRDSDSDSKAA
jgi:transcriptional regulator with XRE-family HTH domain